MNAPSDSSDSSAPPPGVRTMAVVRWVIVALAAAVALFSVLSYLGGRGGGGRAKSNVVYTCPMHPAIIQDHPGECPICGMTLVLKTPPAPAPAGDRAANSVAGLTAVDLTPERIQLIGMKTAVVQRESIGGELRTVGTVTPSERGLSQITIRFSGWIEKLVVSATGERVRRGQVLATVYSPDVLKAQEELLVARGWRDRQQTQEKAAGDKSPPHEHDSITDSLGNSARQRLILLGISPTEIDDILRTGKAVNSIAIRSPSDGYIAAKNAVAGLAVQPGTVLFEVADLGTVWVNADIYEQDMARVKVGQTARFEVPSLPGQPYAGRIQFIYPALDPQNRTLRVRIEFKNRFDKNGPHLRPGMYGSVYLDLPATTGLMVPAEAVVDTGEAKYVFVAKEGGHFEPRAVQVGGQSHDKIEIVSGVQAGDTVVTTGNFLIDSESRLRAGIEGRAKR